MDNIYCADCKPNWNFIGNLTEQYYLVFDSVTNKYLIGDASSHADAVYEFSDKPTYDPFDYDEEADNNDPRWEQYDTWYDKWKMDRNNFKFTPNQCYDIVVSFMDNGWTQKKHGDLFFYILNSAAHLIEKHEQGITTVYSNTVKE